MEWAKAQPVESIADKLLLVVLADHVSGSTHVGAPWIYQVIKATGATKPKLVRGLNRLQNAGLLTFVQTDLAIKVALQIPATWRPSAVLGNGHAVDVVTAVYRLYRTDGRLLYVGISDNPAGRFKDHKAAKPWWWEVVTREITWYPSRLLAKAEEDLAVASENPIYNDFDTGLATGMGSRRRPKLRYAHDVTAPERYAKFKKCFIEALEARKLDVEHQLLMPIPEIAQYFNVEAGFVIKALEEEREKSNLRWYEEGSVYLRRRW